MKTFKEFLNEGLYKTNNHLVSDITKMVYNYACAILLNKLKKSKEDKQLINFAETTIDAMAKKLYYPSFKQIERMKDQTTIIRNINLQKYGKYRYKSIRILITSERTEDRIPASYNDNTKLMTFNLFNFLTVFNFNPIVNIVYLRHLHSLILSYAEHETVHLFQYMDSFHPKQLDQNFDPNSSYWNSDNYFLSTIEFPAMIKSVISSINIIKNNYPNSYRQRIKYYLGLSPDKVSDTDYKDDFLLALKKNDYHKYKKAIKYILGNFNENI